MIIEIQDQARRYKISHSRLKRTAAKILRALGWKKAGLSIMLVSDRKIRVLNKKYLRHDRPTDVIAFHYRKTAIASPFGLAMTNQKGIPFLGDLVISLDTTARQAKEYGNPFFYELSFYLCHGILHLMGHSDKTPREAKKMERKQKAILKKIGL